jgi:hypothetical protein
MPSVDDVIGTRWQLIGSPIRCGGDATAFAAALTFAEAISGACDDAIATGGLVIAADLLSIGQSKRPNPNAIIDALVAKIGALDVRVELAKNRRELHPQATVDRFRGAFNFCAETCTNAPSNWAAGESGVGSTIASTFA